MRNIMIGIPSMNRSHRLESLRWVEKTEIDYRLFVHDEEASQYGKVVSREHLFHYEYNGESLGEQKDIIVQYARRAGYQYCVVCDDDISCIKERCGVTAGGYAKMREAENYHSVIPNMLEMMTNHDLSVVGTLRTRFNVLGFAPEVNLVIPHLGPEFIVIDLDKVKVGYFAGTWKCDTQGFLLAIMKSNGTQSVAVTTKYAHDTPQSGSKGNLEGGLATIAGLAEKTYAEASRLNKMFPEWTRVSEFRDSNKVTLYHLAFRYKEMQQRKI